MLLQRPHAPGIKLGKAEYGSMHDSARVTPCHPSWGGNRSVIPSRCWAVNDWKMGRVSRQNVRQSTTAETVRVTAGLALPVTVTRTLLSGSTIILTWSLIVIPPAAELTYPGNGQAMYIRPAMQVIDATNIQHGLPASSQWLALDIDRPWDHELIDPAPHIVIRNRTHIPKPGFTVYVFLTVLPIKVTDCSGV